ncbi:MAG: DUF6379 domain-containing protein [Parasporobacterium sp.]|nr:DUF6379 domain-containing protein [Parasporobacterium sp.]
MAARQYYDPNGFTTCDKGFSFKIKAQYYRGFTLSILRELKVEIDGEEIPRDDVSITVNGETFTMEEARTVVDSDYRWEFGEFAKVNVKKEGGLKAGNHHLKVFQKIAPSYMPFPVEATCETDFSI